MSEQNVTSDPVVQITFVELNGEKQDEALKIMKDRAKFMSKQPGFISISLHCSRDGGKIVNYLRWQNEQLLRDAHQSHEFRREWHKFDEMTDDIDPHLYDVCESFGRP